MDLLQKCAVAFNRLTGYQYRFTLGRKGKLKEIVLGFGETDFHHLAGLHKLKDINIARDNRQTVFRDILSGRITYQTIEKSAFVHESYLRLETFQFIEDLLDGDQLVSSPAITVIAFSPFLKNSESFSLKIVLFSPACSMLSGRLFFACSTTSIKKKILPLVLSASSTLSAGI